MWVALKRAVFSIWGTGHEGKRHVYFFFGAAFFAALGLAALGLTAFVFFGLLAAFFGAAGFLAFLGDLATFLAAAGFFAATFLAFFGDFLAAAGFFAATFLGFLAAAFLGLVAAVFAGFFLGSACFLLSLKEPDAPVPLVCTRVPFVTRLLTASLTRE